MLYDVKFKYIIESFEKGFVKNKIEEEGFLFELFMNKILVVDSAKNVNNSELDS